MRTLAALFVLSCVAAVHAQRPAPDPAPTRSQTAASIRITLLGTGAGPPVRPARAGVGTLIEAGSEHLLFDAGYGVLRRLVESGKAMDAVSTVFLTHLHSDHVVELPALLLLPWAAPSARDVPLRVWGPAGTRAMMRGLTRAFAADIHLRRDVDEKASRRGIEVESHDIREGVVYSHNGVSVRAFLVDHGPVKPAYGYRVDYQGRSVVISGDTRVSEALVANASGVDVLLHEAIDPDFLRQQAPSPQLFDAIVSHHTTPEQAAGVFARTRPKLAVYTHSPGSQALVDGARRAGYDGPLEIGDDLMVIDVGPEVRVTRTAAPQR